MMLLSGVGFLRSSLTRRGPALLRPCSNLPRSSAVIAEVGTGVAQATEEAESTPNPGSGAFPWKMTTKTNAPQGLTENIKLTLSRAVVGEIYDSSFTDIAAGVVQAFRAVAGCIFLNASASESAEMGMAESPTQNLSEICEARLAKFYGDAITATRSAGHQVHYKLDHVDSSSVTLMDSQILLWSARSIDNSNLRRRPVIFGVSYFEPSLSLTPPRGDVTFDEWEQRKDVQSALKLWELARRHLSIRLVFQLSCKETFYVMDASGRVVQGSKEMREVKHSIIVESSCTGGNGGEKYIKPSDWEVVDLDSWLEGNSFWVHQHKKTASERDRS